MTNRNFVFAGAILLLVGLFVPIVSMPFVGNVSIFGNGSNLFAYVLLAVAGLAAFIAFKTRSQDAVWPGGAAAVLVAALFVELQVRISSAKSQFAEAMADNPFGGMASGMLDAIQLQWGWLVLVAAVASLLYGAIQEGKTSTEVVEADTITKAGSIVLALAGIAWLVYSAGVFSGDEPSLDEMTSDTAEASAAFGDGFGNAAANNEGSGAEKRAYMKDSVEVYDVSASYQDTYIDGRVPGVDFKVRNNGDRALDKVEVTVVFYNAEGNAIAEETYNPVIAGGYDNEPPLKPNYIWQQERGMFYMAKSVPDEWESGSVTAKVTDIQFSPEN